MPATRRSGGGWAWRIPRSAAAWGRAGRRWPGTTRLAGRRRIPCSASLSLPVLTRIRSRAGAWCWSGLPPGGGRRPGRCRRRARSGRGTRGRCCCTRSSRRPAPGRSWLPRPGSRGDTLLSAVSMGFALGAATTGQFKHLAAAEAGPLAGLAALPGLRALRPALARIADRTDPVALQRIFASAMLAADPVTSGSTTSMTTSSPIPGPSRSPRAGTTSGAGLKEAVRTPTSPPMTGGRCASSPGSRPG